MRVFGFGPPRPSDGGVRCHYSLHIQCPWRIDDAERTIVAAGDLYDYAGPAPEPAGWEYDHGQSRQEVALDALLGPRIPVTARAWRYDGRLIVTAVEYDPVFGDLAVHFTTGHVLRVFPEGFRTEQWRLLDVREGRFEDREHLVIGDDEDP